MSDHSQCANKLQEAQHEIDSLRASLARLEKFRADILAAAALNVNVVAKMEYIQMVIDEDKGA